MTLHPEHAHRQIPAIERVLATAPKIQEDLKAKFDHGENIFFYLDLVEYRIKNSALDIAEDLAREHRQTVKERYDLINDQPINSVSVTFRGYNGKHFPEYQFNGLLGKVTNDYIENIRERDGGRASVETHGDQMRIAGRATVETHGDQMRNGGRIGGRARALAQGQQVWSIEHVLDIHKFREESIGKGYFKTKPSWDYITAEMNEKHDEDWTISKLRDAYRSNKERIIKCQ